MRLNTKSYWLTLLLMLLMSAVSAFAQFEVSPDHFDDEPSVSRQADHSRSVTSLKLQIAEQRNLLASYQNQLVQKSALVAKAREAFRTSNDAAKRNDFLKQKSELRKLRESLANPVRNAQLALAQLERQQRALRPSARARDVKGRSAAVLSAAK